MGDVFVPPSSAFPQIGQNRTVGQIVDNLLSFVGGEGNDDMKRRANAALEEAVREYNEAFWSFNRKTQDVALSAGTEFSVENDFAAPERANLLDANGNRAFPVTWLDPQDFEDRYAFDQGSQGSHPLAYTVSNGHETGLLTVWPTLAAPLTYATLRLRYFRRIVLPANLNSVLNVPVEVEGAIASLALANLIAQSRGYEAARDQRILAKGRRLEIEGRYRTFPDF